jgi:hypothetical protein
MRILSFSEKWPKLHLELPIEHRPDFTTFRYWYWQEGWPVQIYYKARSREHREKLGEATIYKAEPRELDKWIAEKGWNDYPRTTNAEARMDGFADLDNMVNFMQKQYGLDWHPVMNKLTLKWGCSKVIGEGNSE